MNTRPFSASAITSFAQFRLTDSPEESFYLASVRHWTDQDVETWLAGCRCAAHAPLFAQNDLRGEVILDLTQDTLKEMGITSVGDRARILVAVKQLRLKCYAKSLRSSTLPTQRTRTRPTTFSAPSTPFFSSTGTVSETLPVTPGSAPFYAPTGAIYFAPEQPVVEEPAAITPRRSPLQRDFVGLAATDATPAIHIQNPSPLESPAALKSALETSFRPSEASDEPSPRPGPPTTDSQPPPPESTSAPGDESISSAAVQPQQDGRRVDSRILPAVNATPSAVPAHLTHARKLSARRHAQLYVVAAPPAVPSLKAY